MKRTALLLIVSVLVCVAAAGQSSRGLAGILRDRDRGWLGVSIQDVSKKLAEKENLKVASGAYVSDVVEDSPAEEAGILEGDVIVKFGTKEIDDSDDLTRAVRRSEPGDEIAIVVNRGGDSKTLKAKLDDLPAPRAFSFTIPKIPRVPRIAPVHPSPFRMHIYRSSDRLGMEIQDLGTQLAEFLDVPGNRGVLVTSVARKGPAADAGVKAGDVIVKVNKSTVRDVDDVMEEVREARGETVPFEVVRKGKTVTLSLAVGEEDEDLSYYYDLNRGEYRDALRLLESSAAGKRDLLHGLKDRLLELKEELKDNARELRETLREEFRSF